jgi:6-phosphogluconolactonase (cycloisomerase 2 family)
VLSNVVNPGYLTLHPHRPVLYAVQPVANVVSAFAIDNRSGELESYLDGKRRRM